MIAVLDTSAAVELIMGRPQSVKIHKVLSSSRLVVSPDLFSAEITNVFWKLNKFGELERECCESAITHTVRRSLDEGGPEQI